MRKDDLYFQSSANHSNLTIMPSNWCILVGSRFVDIPCSEDRVGHSVLVLSIQNVPRQRF